MNKKIWMILSVSLCAILLLTGASVNVYAASNEKAASASRQNTEDSAAEEMNYIFANAAGTTQKVYVSRGNGYTEETVTPPVELTVSYTLDGKSVTPAELAGKSGHVVIRFDYKNQAVKGGIHAPYAALTAVIMDNDLFSNIQITNGKLISDGDRTVAAGIALPGLQEDLKLDRGLLELPEYVEITADVKEFALMETYTIVTGEIFQKLNVEALDFSDLDHMKNSLTDAMTQLTAGAGQLADGLDTLLASCGALADGVGDLKDGAAQLSAGLDTLSGNSTALSGGARQVFDTLLATADSQLAAAGLELPKLTIENYEEVLDNVIRSLDSDSVTATARKQVEAAVNAQRETIEAAVTAKVREGVTAQVLAAMGLPSEASEQPAVMTAVDAQMQTEEVQALIAQNCGEQIDLLIEQNMQSPEVKALIAQALESVQALAALKAQLNSYHQFYTGLCQYTSGVDSAAVGAASLSAGAGRLADAIPDLLGGVTALRDGALQLRDGLNTFREEAVQKLLNVLDEGSPDRLQEVMDAADGTARFLYRTEAIGD